MFIETFEFNIFLNGYEPRDVLFIDSPAPWSAMLEVDAKPGFMYIAWDLDSPGPGRVYTGDRAGGLQFHGYTGASAPGEA